MLWNKRFLGLAAHVSTWSKDMSTKCGAVIVRPNKSIASLGFNGFPQGIQDVPEMLVGEPDPHTRVKKLERVIHAEMNALLFLPERGPDLTMYVWPMLPCNRCAVHIIQSGIARVVAPVSSVERWQGSMDLSRRLFTEARVTVEEIEYEIVTSGSGGAGGYTGPMVVIGQGGRQGRDYDL